jgi:hypothetical protein
MARAPTPSRRTDVDCRAARPKFDKGAWSPAKISDVTGRGLYLFVTPDESRPGDPASKLWRMGYRFHSRQKTYSIGPYGNGKDGTFEIYKAVSEQIREIFAEHTPIIEPLSLDEAYLDVTENLQGIPLARDVALAIRAKIKEVTGLNASAGISYNKFLAKLASDHRKPNGQYVITPEMGPAFVEALPVGKFHGIGPATSAKMNALGLYTPASTCAISRSTSCRPTSVRLASIIIG